MNVVEVSNGIIYKFACAKNGRIERHTSVRVGSVGRGIVECSLFVWTRCAALATQYSVLGLPVEHACLTNRMRAT